MRGREVCVRFTFRGSGAAAPSSRVRRSARSRPERDRGNPPHGAGARGGLASAHTKPANSTDLRHEKIDPRVLRLPNPKHLRRRPTRDRCAACFSVVNGRRRAVASVASFGVGPRERKGRPRRTAHPGIGQGTFAEAGKSLTRRAHICHGYRNHSHRLRPRDRAGDRRRRAQGASQSRARGRGRDQRFPAPLTDAEGTALIAPTRGWAGTFRVRRLSMSAS